MRQAEVKIGQVYQLAERYRRTGGFVPFAKVLDGPLPMATRGRFGFLLLGLSGTFIGQQRMVRASSMHEHVWDAKVIRRIVQHEEDRLDRINCDWRASTDGGACIH